MLLERYNRSPTLFLVFLLNLIIISVTIVFIRDFPVATSPKLKRVANTTAPRLTEGNPSNTVSKNITLLFWSKLWGVPAKRAEGILPKGNQKGQCPVACEVTANHSRIKEANAFIVHSRDPRPLPPNKDIPWILTTLENPVYTPVLRDPEYMKQFHLLRSYRLDSDFPTPSFKRPNLNPPIPFENKTGGIMAAFSNCEPVRTKYLRELMKYVKIDSYGACLNNKQGLIRRYGGNFKQIKSELQRRYKFAITFFNQDCDYFVDDQILHALNAGAVPIVMSTDKIMQFLPGNLKNSIVNVRDFKNPKELADQLKFLMNNKTEYNRYLEWKFKGLGDIEDTIIGKYWTAKFHPWCQICQAIAQGSWHREGLKFDVCQSRKYQDWGI